MGCLHHFWLHKRLGGFELLLLRVHSSLQEYAPAKLPYGQPHPDAVVETASLAAVEPPDITYTLKVLFCVLLCCAAVLLRALACCCNQSRRPCSHAAMQG